MRGRRSVWRRKTGAGGLIPAGAGQTSRATCPISYLSAHPRGCGADCGYSVRKRLRRGSSPRVRGRHGATHRARAGVGLIPAGAGQTLRPTSHATATTAHPRGCGADAGEQSNDTRAAGSSPRVRGRLIGGQPRPTSDGLIPAGAGQTLPLCGRARRSRAHPRGCGADFWTAIWICGFMGLIPAGAGQTAEGYRSPRAHRAHPRGCGADSGRGRLRPRNGGSSPRVRGRRVLGGNYAGGVGLIPAGAGQTWEHRGVDSPDRAHPRGCGADGTAVFLRENGGGSSPRVRGRPIRVGTGASGAAGSSPRVRGRRLLT